MAIDTRTNGHGRGGVPGVGLVKGLAVTLKHMLSRSITQQYPDEMRPLPARTRGVIALKQENCTVCYKCARECPDWCIYIDAQKETHEPASGGRGRSVKVLDRFAIDYALCMYCGICVEACPFDALFWSPEFEYAEYDIVDLIHEKDRLEEWTYKVLPPPELEEGAEPPAEVIQESKPVSGEEGAVVATGATAGPAPAAKAEPGPTPPAPTPEPVSPAPAPAQASGTVAAAGEHAVMPTRSGPHEEEVEMQPDPGTLERVLQEELAKGTDRRVAEGKARRAAMLEARRKAGGS